MGKTVGRTSFNQTGRFVLVHGDLTEERVDVIVNAANERLEHGGGVAAAIAKAGGDTIRAESSRWIREHGPIDHTSPAITGAGNLPCKAVIHALGPRRGSGREESKLRAAVQAALHLADQQGFESLALPPISTGIFGYPAGEAAGVLFGALRDFFASNPDSRLREVRLVIIDKPTLEIFAASLESQLEMSSDAA